MDEARVPRAGRFLIPELPVHSFFAEEARRLKPAGTSLQDSHDMARAKVTSAIGRNITVLQRACPEVAEAMRDYAAFLARNPSVTFRLMRVDDLELTVEAGDRLFLR